MEYCVQHVYKQLGENVCDWNEELLRTAIEKDAFACVEVLFRWGFYTHQLPSLRVNAPITAFQRACEKDQVKH